MSFESKELPSEQTTEPTKVTCASALVTFIIPTIGRPTLTKTLDSILNNTDPNWNAIVMFDGIQPTIGSNDPRIRIYYMEKKGRLNHAGIVRNTAIQFATTPWIGFVDDDDAISPRRYDFTTSRRYRFPCKFCGNFILPQDGIFYKRWVLVCTKKRRRF